jgi:hypothetical protein
MRNDYRAMAGDREPRPYSDEDLVLTDVEKRALIALLKRTIDEARFPYSPQLAPLKVILAKLVPPE